MQRGLILVLFHDLITFTGDSYF